MIFVLEKVMHAQPEIFQAELAKVFPSNSKRIKVVLFEISPKLAPLLLVFAPDKAESEEKQRYNNRSKDVDRKLALQCVSHDGASIIHARRIYDRRSGFASLGKVARIHGCFSSQSFWNAGSVRKGSQSG